MTDQPVRLRRVFFCTGYAPNGPDFFYDMFRRQVERYQRKFDVTGTVSPYQTDADGVCTHWSVELHSAHWSGQTHYTVLNWGDLVTEYMRRPKLITWLLKFIYVVDAVVTGTYFRLCRLNWRFGVVCTYPSLAVVLLLVLAWIVASGSHTLGQSWGVDGGLNYGVAALLGCATFMIGYWLLSLKHFLHLLVTDGVFSLQHARSPCEAYSQRVDEFAERIVTAIHESKDDEVLIVGHSSGSFCTVEILARALRMDPKLMESGPRVSLLTVGANLPLVGCHPKAQRFRDDLALVATEKHLFWLEYQAKQDLLNFPQFDPVRDLPSVNLTRPQMNPVVYSACIHKSLSPANYRRLRFNCFRLHYQFILAVDRLVPCDYMMIVAGPASLEHRGLNPQSAMEMCHGVDHWAGSEEELQPWLPLPPGRRQDGESVTSVELTPPRSGLRRTVVRQLLAVALSFVAGVIFAESLPHQEPPQEDGWSSGQERQPYSGEANNEQPQQTKGFVSEQQRPTWRKDS